ncbi:MAG: hypothetical protein DRI90_17385, partial [Deltaproteobacteria bacterium]
MLRPGRLLIPATERLFRHIEGDAEWRTAVEAIARRGPVVYVLRNVSAVDYLALEHLTQRMDLPRIGFVNDLPAPFAPQNGTGGLEPAEQLRETVAAGHSAALFVKRAPTRTSTTHRGRSEGATLLESLLALQAAGGEREIMMMPQTFVWGGRSERLGWSLVDTIFGPADFPGELRQAAQFLANRGKCQLRAGEPLSLREFLQRQGSDQPTPALLRQLTYALLRKVERERRTIVGPARKAPDRLREEVVQSPKLQKVIRELAGPGEGRALLTDKARVILKAMQTIPDPETARGFEMVAETVLEHVFAGFDIDREGLERLRKVCCDGAVILLPSHRSHVDYLLISCLLLRNSIQAPAIAAGENLSFFPAGPLLRRGGAFFIRRRVRGDRLYAAVLNAYLRRLVRDGHMIEFFLEGGRSRTGKLLPPKLGLLNMIVAAALSLNSHRIFFQPISIGYERLMEEGAYARELSGQKKQKENAAALLGIRRVLTDRWGRVNVQFGQPFELSELRDAAG